MKKVNFNEVNSQIYNTRYYYYEFDNLNFGIFSITFSIDDWLSIKPLEYIWSKYIINYKNYTNEKALLFLQKVNNHCCRIKKRQFDKKEDDFLNCLNNATKILKRNI